MARRLIVVGGIAAGLSAASKAKRLMPDLEVTVYEKSGFASTGACGLPYFIGGTVKRAQDLLSLTVEDLRDKRGIFVLTGHEVIEIDPQEKTVEVRCSESGRSFTDRYDNLVIATGAASVRPSLPNLEAEGVFFLRTLEDGIALRNAVENGAKRAVIAGGGLIGLEAAEQLAEAGLEVVIAEAMPRLLPALTEEYAEIVRQELMRNGVAVELGAMVEDIFARDGKVVGLRLSNGRELRTDILLMATGVAPNTGLARRCGAELGVKGTIAVDNHMRTSVPSIWACGDCVQSYHIITGQPCWIPSGPAANKQGRVAGSGIGGEYAIFRGVLGTQITKIFGLYAATTGLNLEAAVKAGFDARSASIIKGDKASYYPGSVNSHVTFIFEGRGGRLLGAQILGGISAAGRCNTLVAAISAGMTVSEINELDLAYSPTVAPVYDPLLIAAAQAGKQVTSG